MQGTISRPLRVFLIDDSDLVRRTLADLLGLLPQIDICGEAASVAGALTGLAARRPDVVILDLNLSDESGLDLLHAIKVGIPEAIVIILTNHPYHELGDQCLEAGADYYFEKGGDLDAMLTVLIESGKSKVPAGSESATNGGQSLSGLAEQKAHPKEMRLRHVMDREPMCIVVPGLEGRLRWIENHGLRAFEKTLPRA